MYSKFLWMYPTGFWYNKTNNKVGFAWFSQETFLTIYFAFLPLHGPPQLYLFFNLLSICDIVRGLTSSLGRVMLCEWVLLDVFCVLMSLVVT